MKEKLKKNKYICAVMICFLIALLCEIFVFNISAWKSRGFKSVEIAKDTATDENWEYRTDIFTVDGPVVNVYADLTVSGYDTALVQVTLTDAGDKYEYDINEYAVQNDVKSSGYANIYPFGDVHTIQVKVSVPEGNRADIRSVTINAHKPVEFKFLRFLIFWAVITLGALIFGQSPIHNIYYDEKRPAQWIMTLLVMIFLLILGRKMVTANPIFLESPWPHHKQYQELAHSLSKGSVVLDHEVSPGLLEAENPYDTIALMAEEVPFNMDYAYYNGKYYEYFGIVPELLFYYPYYMATGADLPNYKAIYGFYIILVIGVFLTSTGLAGRYTTGLPYVFFLMLNIAAVLSANFVYLTIRPDIYNVPIMGASACTFMGLGLWLWNFKFKAKVPKIVFITAGSLFMALVAGCRPQLLLLSLCAVIFFVTEKGLKERELFAKGKLTQTVCFVVPYLLVAVIVCYYNYARFGNIFDFGATYSLTTNDMNNRGFNMSRLMRGLYCFLLQPASMGTDFPYLNPIYISDAYMGRSLSEYTYGGILVSNLFLAGIWLWLFKGIKKAAGPLRVLVGMLVAIGVVVAAFDANAAGVLYRYTCDFSPAFVLAALLLWILYLDRGRVLIDYGFVSGFAYVCLILSLFYSFMTVMANGSSVNMLENNRKLYYLVRSYFGF